VIYNLININRMLKQITEYVIVALLSIATIAHLGKLAYLYFKPAFLKRFDFISNPVPSKTYLTLYYVLTVIVCVYAITTRVSSVH